MSEQEYVWMLGAISAWQQLEDDRDSPKSIGMERVTGVSGSLSDYQEEAANEMAARLFILLLILSWTSANKSAKTLKNGPDFCKIPAAAFFPLLAAIPYQMAAAGFRALTQGSAKSITSPQ